jgi:hypothetical protein
MVECNSQLRLDIERIGRDLIDVQALEAGYRATSQHLLHGQGIRQNLIKKVVEESTVDRQQSQSLINDLELQISDLKSNQRMMQQFSQNEGLKNSQILGTEPQLLSLSTKPNRNQKSKRNSRLFRK